MTARRILMLAEAALAATLAAIGACVAGVGLVSGRDDPRHGGGFITLAGFLIVLGAGAFALAAWALRGTRGWGWLGQALLLALITWLLWGGKP